MVKDIDLLRWVAANPNKPFDPNMVVSTSTGHTDDWEWQAVLHQMEELSRLNYIRRTRQDSGGSTYWTITERGKSYLSALERTEKTTSENAIADAMTGPRTSTTDAETGSKPVTATVQPPLAPGTRPFPGSGEEQGTPDQPSREKIYLFTDRARTIFEIADHLRLSRNRPAISTLHLVRGFASQPEGQFRQTLRELDVSLDLLISPTDDMPEEGLHKGIASSAAWQLPPVTDDVLLALINARAKASESSSEAIIDDSHLLFGLLSISGTDNFLIQELNRRGITADKVRLPATAQGGPSTHVARDRWTVDDSLGYFPYAYAIFRFLTDENTAPPLAVSIQAPWGGGKTSLMRMIQARLDPQSQMDTGGNRTTQERATIRDVIAELDRLEAPGSRDQVPEFPSPRETGQHRVTIWFNAWKYESTNQVWAGLADSILRQVSDRLGPIERELFWLRLQLHRIDAGTIRRKIYEQVWTRFWSLFPSVLWKYLISPSASLLLVLAGKLLRHGTLASLGWAAVALAIGADVVFACRRWTKTESEIASQAARASLGECVQAPDYAANLGFVHQVTDDLRKVFELIPTEYLPMVIFIDDLDRCSPNKVSDVVEAINLFLAGEFPDCMFVLGIDAEMVAAALDNAHSGVISRLPSYAKSTSIGWRFMDKFVQLPFLVPPPTSEESRRYISSLYSEGIAHDSDVGAEVEGQAAQIIESSTTIQAPEQIVEEVAKNKNLSAQQREALADRVTAIQRMDQNIRAFSDEEQKIKDFLVDCTADFSTNPRDIKRFVNVFRFYYFLRAAREAREEPVPSLSQMGRWILLSLKWPEAVRYFGRAQVPTYATPQRELDALERLARNCSSVDEWRRGAATILGTDATDKSWFWSSEIMRFFQMESGRPESDRLSASYGKGLW